MDPESLKELLDRSSIDNINCDSNHKLPLVSFSIPNKTKNESKKLSNEADILGSDDSDSYDSNAEVIVGGASRRGDTDSEDEVIVGGGSRVGKKTQIRQEFVHGDRDLIKLRELLKNPLPSRN